MTLLAGYLIKQNGGLRGERGIAYDYVLAGNGLFLEAESKFMAARIPVSPCEVRGLAPLEPQFVLRHGLIPQRLFDLAVDIALTDIHRERFMAIVWEDGYRLKVPDQDRKEAIVKYAVVENTVMDLHSHGEMRAFFSGQDDKDEQGFQLYGVIGRSKHGGQVKLRTGAYGYFHEIDWQSVFEGELDASYSQEDEIDLSPQEAYELQTELD